MVLLGWGPIAYMPYYTVYYSIHGIHAYMIMNHICIRICMYMYMHVKSYEGLQLATFWRPPLNGVGAKPW